MPRPERTGVCGRCHGKIRYYPHFSGDVDFGSWAHLDRADWIEDPHDPEPIPETLRAAGLPSE